ncbi:MAG TPA: hypothetical protein DCE42_12480 [Myxococcales bacterium]|nr:hypothetical protein [Deltaproteobacteria bacterium]HAA55569.1 hypothetical protein [Myxococcales bacterium]|tara:strand:- start:7710 stop:8501 length:792 start_codon:yes stop_codon:yes gene_type:complete
MSSIVTLTTDFGLRDAYVGIMKGVVLSLDADVQIVDLCHEIGAQDVRQGAYALWSAVDAFPPGTIHVAVVDPGVGSERRSIAVQAGGQRFVGPDNGLLWEAVQRFSHFRAVELDNPDFFHSMEPSATFHGRDIFASVAGHLSRGVPFEELGTPIEDPRKMVLFNAEQKDKVIHGRLLLSDHFGNIVTNISQRFLREVSSLEKCELLVGHQIFRGIKRTFSDVEAGEPVVYVNSFGLVEIGVRNGSAQETFPLTPDLPVELRLP